ncbi:MAG: EamA family transporter [Chloroflexi bacterium]|nr:EamA family transporter [Chloroflexota bacterium]
MGVEQRTPAHQLERGHLFALGTVIVWGSLHPISKIALEAFGPAQLTLLRVGLATITLFSICLLTGQLHSLKRASRRDWLGLLALGVAGGCLSPLLATYGLRITPASVAALTSNTSPLLVALIAPVLLGERLGRLLVGGVILGFCGVLLIIQPGSGPGGKEVPVVGVILGTVSAAAWAVFMVLGRQLMARHRPLTVTMIASAIGCIMIGVTALLDGGLTAGFEALPRLWPNVLWIGMVSNGLCYGAWMAAIHALGAGRVAPFQYLAPVSGAVLSFLILGEQPTVPFLAGGGLILTGVALSQVQRSPLTR